VAITHRETEVLDLLSRGLRDGEIAAVLGIALPTVKTHLRNLFLKTGQAGRTQLALWWQRERERERERERGRKY
jgi:DNA-binding CsgD family transcriptional regulator